MLSAAAQYGPNLLRSNRALLDVVRDDLDTREPSSLAPRVVVLCQASLAALAVIVAHHVAGFVHTPLSSTCTEHELLHVLDDAAPLAVVVDDADEDHIAQLHELLVARNQGRASSADVPATGVVPPCSLITVGLHADGTLRSEVVLTASGTATRDSRLAPHDGDNSESALWSDLVERQRRDEATTLMIYTSGTTGRPKGVELSYRALVGAMSSLGSLWGFCPRDRVIVTLPLFHVHGLGIGVFASLLCGARVQLHARFAPDKVTAAIDEGGTVFLGVPTMYARLIEHMRAEPSAAKQLAKARLFTAGSAALVPQHFQAFLELTGHRILERYGMSETLITLSNPLDGDRRIGSVGQAVPGFEVRVVDEAGSDVPDNTAGELWVRGVGLMNGYHGRAEATAEVMRDGGWFTTGDVVERDASGYIRILGRSSVDIIKSGGLKISALEIEDALTGASGIRELAVFGIEDEDWGQLVCVATALSDLSTSPAELLAALVEQSSTRLSKYKLPRALVVLSALPRSPLGKVQKPEIRRQIDAGLLPVHRSKI